MTIDDLKARPALKFMMQFVQFNVTAVNFHSRLDGQSKIKFCCCSGNCLDPQFNYAVIPVVMILNISLQNCLMPHTFLSFAIQSHLLITRI